MLLNPNLLNDIAMDTTGEPSIGSNGDFKFTIGSDTVIQEAMFRLKTVAGDWTLVPSCGASLESMVGEPNSRETGESLATLAINSLTHDGFLGNSQVSVTPIPVNSSTILLMVIITYDGRQTTLSVALDLVEGKLSVERA
jgi:hypothetical protein